MGKGAPQKHELQRWGISPGKLHRAFRNTKTSRMPPRITDQGLLYMGDRMLFLLIAFSLIIRSHLVIIVKEGGEKHFFKNNNELDMF